MGDVKGKVALAAAQNQTFTATEVIDLLGIAVAKALLANDEKVNVRSFATRMTEAAEAAKVDVAQIEAVNA